MSTLWGRSWPKADSENLLIPTQSRYWRGMQKSPREAITLIPSNCSI